MAASLVTNDLLKLFQVKYGIIGESREMVAAIGKVALAAPTDLSILITGETGTGKEIFANAIHGLSNRKKFPFISVNCGAIPPTLLESELFGHEKGAFTGATDQRKGFFEVADKGTIFLDEIGEMPFETQSKLLRVLESGEFTRLGSTLLRRVDVRVIAATNRDLTREVENNSFRQDLLFRLNAVHIELPALKQHPEDIPKLIEYFAKKTCEKLGLKYDGISPDALEIFKNLPLPGNVRQLKNLVETLITLEQETYITLDILMRYIPKALPARNVESTASATSLLRLNDLREEPAMGMGVLFHTLLELKHDLNSIKSMINSLSLQMDELKVDVQSTIAANYQTVQTEETSPILSENELNLSILEKQLIRFALSKHNGNRRLAANELGISERTLYRKLQDYEIN